jgi:hypothetical protein
MKLLTLSALLPERFLQEALRPTALVSKRLLCGGVPAGVRGR